MIEVPTLDEVRRQLDRAIAGAQHGVRSGEETQEYLDDLLERRSNVEGLHAFMCTLADGGALQ